MSSSDVRDVLNLPDGAAGARPSKKQKVSAPRPSLKGLAREVHQLGGDNPIAIVPEVTQFKKRRLASRKPAARWELRPFRNSGREDRSLVLRHWRRKETKEGQEETQQDAEHQTGPEMEDSAFAKFNVQVSVPQYSDDQYRQSLRSDDWSKEETDYLMDLVRDYDIRWPIIWDRYEWNPPATNGEANADGDESKAVVPTARSRTMEDLKARYYEVAAKMMAAQKPVQYMTQPEFALHELMANFNAQQEKARKDFAIHSLSRSREEAREEESLLLEIKRIMARSERFNEERRELYNRLDYPRGDADISSLKSSAGLQALLQTLMTVDKTKKRKSIMGADGVSPGGTTTQQAGAQDSAKRESTAASTGNNNRESIGAAATPTGGNKKAAQQQQQQQQQQAPPQQQQQQPQERRKLTSQEEAIYGVTRHDRLGSGPSFRTEKINKMFSHKSNQQQIRINNTLNELDVPSKLAMPTAATTLQYEQLLAAVNGLLDARKVSDKLDAEIKLESAKKAEREKTTARTGSGPDAEATKTEANAETGGSDEKAAEGPKETAISSGDNGNGEEQPQQSDLADKGDGANDTQPLADGQDAGQEEQDDKADEGKSGRPGSSGTNHKRSASVLSAVSDKSAKRQKK
ncbi:swr complex subunit [Purpureocillium takamizusanense]|uniref:SWR1-complex protein 4 n=1 Tax=Purpureocillium takamizusanense TaxID=2060973 RepID=A0A9Q8QJ90_9HYPO|nr:swr complex subunit [Purpureocillium takamizusanense]UNI20655.1 swr complex subunit [Purpureocillium takamizusanense]